MYKKLSIFLVALFVVFALAGCKKKANADDIFKANFPEMVVEGAPLNESKLIAIANAENENLGQLSRGLITVTYEDGSKSVYSMIAEKLLFPARENINITFSTWNNYDAYVNVLDTLTNERVIYDVLGNKVLAEGQYLDYSVSGTVDVQYDKKGNITGRFFNEVVSYVYKDANDEEQESVSYYKINLDTRERTSYNPEEDDEDEYIGQVGKIDLDEIGLPNHYGMELDNTFYVYKKKDDKLVSSFRISHGDVIAGFGGKLLVEIEDKVTENEDYTYINRFDDYYRLKYQVIDVLTGKTKDLKIDYMIDDIQPFLDKNGNVKYALVYALDIINKKVSDNGYYLLIDAEGKTIKDYGSINVSSILPLTGGIYFDPNSEFLLSKDLAPTIKVTSFNTGVPGHKLIIRGRNFNRNLGMINYEGKILIPHNHAVLDTEFHKGKLYGKNRDDDSFLYNEKGEKTALTGEYEQITLGLLVKINESSVSVVDYEQKVIHTINDVDNYNHDARYAYTLFGTFVFLVVEKTNDAKVYVKIDVTRK